VAIAAGYVGFGALGTAWPPRSRRFSGLLAAFGFSLLLLVDAATR
jgi:hypothetical protein